jgi:hypothetical protein
MTRTDWKAKAIRLEKDLAVAKESVHYWRIIASQWREKYRTVDDASVHIAAKSIQNGDGSDGE